MTFFSFLNVFLEAALFAKFNIQRHLEIVSVDHCFVGMGHTLLFLYTSLNFLLKTEQLENIF